MELGEKTKNKNSMSSRTRKGGTNQKKHTNEKKTTKEASARKLEGWKMGKFRHPEGWQRVLTSKMENGGARAAEKFTRMDLNGKVRERGRLAEKEMRGGRGAV